MAASKTPAKSLLQKKSSAGVAAHRAEAARKAIVLGRVKARGGKFYQVLAPAAAPKHVSAADIDRAVRQVVAAR
jgi:hypothetical protein